MTDRRTPCFEPLEARELFSFTAVGLSPAQVRHAYGFDKVSFQVAGHTIAGDGSGQTIAVVDAYDDPNVYTDLRSFDHQFGLTDWDSSGQFVLTKARPEGRTSPDAGWALEESLDVQWAHAIAPKAHILLVEAASAGVDDLLTAVDYARSQPGVVAVSMSWGGGEFPAESFYDDTLMTPSGHVGGSGLRGGVTFVTSSGDQGAPAGWPAVSPNVLAVGGTSLRVGARGDYLGETAWGDSGGGTSFFENTVTSAPDVAYDADPNTGFAVFCSYGSGRKGPWVKVGGTSAGSPQWAALIAIADQGRALTHRGSLTSAQTLADIYRIPAADFHDIVTGSNGVYSAGPGYDLVTGRGTPFADRIIRDTVRL